MPKYNSQKYNNQAARSQAQLGKMKELESKGLCIFCMDVVTKESKNPIEFETSHWYVKKNDYPYENTELHLIVAPKDHIKTITELSEEAKAEFLNVISEIEKRYKTDSFAIGIRSGDMRFNGGSIEHLHAHFIVAKPNPDKDKQVRFKMSSYPAG
jgi:ATP adenylyltransferase